MKQVSEIKPGTVIRWNCYDSDDNTTWTMMGIIQKHGVFYLGGGIDFGEAIGRILPFSQVQEEFECNDSPELEELGPVSDLVRHIAQFKK